MYLNQQMNLAVLLVPKNASTSIQKLFEQSFGEATGPELEAGKESSGHPTLQEFKDVYNFNSDGMNILGVVRNPYDRFVSFCAYTYPQIFVEKPQTVMGDCLLRDDVGLRTQHEYLKDANDIIDYAFLETQVAGWIQKYGLSGTLDHYNASLREPGYDQYYTPELRSAVARRYAEDFEIYRYQY